MIPLRGSSHGVCQPEHALWGLEQRPNNDNKRDEAADADMLALPDIKADKHMQVEQQQEQPLTDIQRLLNETLSLYFSKEPQWLKKN